MNRGLRAEIGMLEMLAARQVDLALADHLPELLRPSSRAVKVTARDEARSPRLLAAAVLRRIADLLQPEPADLSPSIGRS